MQVLGNGCAGDGSPGLGTESPRRWGENGGKSVLKALCLLLGSKKQRVLQRCRELGGSKPHGSTFCMEIQLVCHFLTNGCVAVGQYRVVRQLVPGCAVVGWSAPGCAAVGTGLCGGWSVPGCAAVGTGLCGGCSVPGCAVVDARLCGGWLMPGCAVVGWYRVAWPRPSC